MLSELNNLLEVDLSAFDISENTSSDFIFFECTSLTSINLNNLNSPSLT